jgi:hypothetical protein
MAPGAPRSANYAAQSRDPLSVDSGGEPRWGHDDQANRARVELTKGDPYFTLLQVALNELIMVFAASEHAIASENESLCCSQ